MNPRPIRDVGALAIVLLCLCIPGVGSSATGRDVVLMIDNSGSMKRNDPAFLTKPAVEAFLDELQGDNHVAIVIFDQRVRLAVPLTPLTPRSRPAFSESLKKVDFRGLYTDSPAALERSIYELKSRGRETSEKSIVFLTDGIVDTGNKARDLDKARWMREELAADAAEHGIRIFGVAFTESADYQLIQSLAQRTGAEYYRAFSASDIHAVFGRINTGLDTAPTSPDTAPTTFPLPPLAITETVSEPIPEPVPLPEHRAEPAGALPEPPSEEDVGPPPLLPPLEALPPLPQETETPAQAPPERPESLVETPGQKTGAPEAASAEPAAETPETPTPAPKPAPASSEDAGLPSAYLLLLSAGVLLALAAAVVAILRKGKSDDRAPVEAPPQAYLSDLNHITDQASYDLTGKLIQVGRLAGPEVPNAVYVVIDETTIGRRHAIIEYKDHAYRITDQNSLNGTFVNDERVHGAVPLKHGDKIRFHKHEFEFLMKDMFETDRTMFSETLVADLVARDTAEEASVIEADSDSELYAEDSVAAGTPEGSEDEDTTDRPFAE